MVDSMTRKSRVLVVLVLATLVVAACGAPLAQAAAVGRDMCGPTTGWGPAKTDAQRAAASLLVDLAAIPV
ncbi:MAG: hypothetical protein ACRENJ_02230, partial [Candidatus Eiseniibacteriota bacterium]